MKPISGGVAATALAIAALAVSHPAVADTLIDNVDGITIGADGAPERLTGLVIGDDGRVVQVLHRGDKPGRVQYRVDGMGRTLLPGFVDGHTTVMALGFAALTLDLSPARSAEEALARIAAYAAAHSDRPWILGRGWNADRWPATPAAADLDTVVKDRPVWLISADGHSGWANSAALAAAGITAATPAPVGGRIEHLGKLQGNRPSGILRETAMALVDKAVPEPRPEDRDLAFAEAQALLLRNGITTVTDMATTMADWQAYRRAGDMGRLQLRIVGYAPTSDAMSLIGGPGPSPWLYEDRLRFNGLALVLDGVPATAAAWSKAGGGSPRIGRTPLRNLMSRAGIDRFQVAIEAHGSAAVGEALDAAAELAQTYKGERRWRIEGLDEIDETDIARLGRDTVATLQPGTGPAARLERANVRVALGSGAPAGTPAPFAAMAAAITRGDGETLTREQALAAWTTRPAWAAFAEAHVGRLAPGLRADFILVDRDPLLAAVGELKDMKVLETWVGGRKVWAAPAATAPTQGGR